MKDWNDRIAKKEWDFYALECLETYLRTGRTKVRFSAEEAEKIWGTDCAVCWWREDVGTSARTLTILWSTVVAAARSQAAAEEPAKAEGTS
jgi:hypothetical protein